MSDCSQPRSPCHTDGGEGAAVRSAARLKDQVPSPQCWEVKATRAEAIALAAREMDAAADLHAPAELNGLIADLQDRLSQAGQPGKVKSANDALKQLVDLLVLHKCAREHGSTLRDNAMEMQRVVDAPTWEGVISRVLFCLSMSKTLAKAAVDKLRMLLGKALEVGPPAFGVKAELKVFLYMCEELRDEGDSSRNVLPRAPARVDGKSAHPECIGVLLMLASERPHMLARLPPLRRRDLLDLFTRWIVGDGGSREGADDNNTKPASGGREASEAAVLAVVRGQDPTVTAAPQLLLQYAQLLHQLVVTWVVDFPVLERAPAHGPPADGPFIHLTGFMTDVCERQLPHLKRMANQLWSAVLHAVLAHGANALHEVAAFGLDPCVGTSLLQDW